jgi:tetratricopeptide (TPR) repeat protein
MIRSMPRATVLVLLTLVLLAWSKPILAAEQIREQTFAQAAADYQAGRFDVAAAGYETLASAGLRNAALYYNIGNAWLKQNDLGRAVLWYERGLLLAPNDPDLRFNLDYARTQLKDAYEPDESALASALFFWKDLLSRRAVQYAALAANALFWLGLIWLRLRSGKGPAGLNGAVKLLCGIALLGLALFAPTALFQQYEECAEPRAVVLVPEAAVRSGLSDEATALFTLHAGSVARVEEKRPGYARIRFGKDKIGWIKESQIERI